MQTTVTKTVLYITVSHKSADEMAVEYGINAGQKEQLAALLAEENDSMWSAVLYGIGPGENEIVAVALSQIGNVGGMPYWFWYGFTSRARPAAKRYTTEVGGKLLQELLLNGLLFDVFRLVDVFFPMHHQLHHNLKGCAAE